jgi:hypothetical protein
MVYYMSVNPILLPYNVALTPENSEIKGYEYLQDVIYDEDAPLQAMKDILKHFIHRDDFVLGGPALELTLGTTYGLYRRLRHER